MSRARVGGDPADGLRDAYAGIALPLAGGKAQAWYHDFRSDRGSYRYGREFNLSWERAVPQLKGLSVLLKAARYRSHKQWLFTLNPYDTTMAAIPIVHGAASPRQS